MSNFHAQVSQIQPFYFGALSLDLYQQVYGNQVSFPHMEVDFWDLKKRGGQLTLFIFQLSPYHCVSFTLLFSKKNYTTLPCGDGSKFLSSSASCQLFSTHGSVR